MPRIDCNAFLGAYPWRKVPGTSADALLKALARTKIDAAWVTHLPASREPGVIPYIYVHGLDAAMGIRRSRLPFV